MILDIEPLWCETCGEQVQEVSLVEIGLCGDCAGEVFTKTLEKTLGYLPCGRPIFKADKMVLICVQPYGTEHDHS